MLNRVILMGRLVADPELKTTGTGISVTSFRIAVDRNYVKSGEDVLNKFIEDLAEVSQVEKKPLLEGKNLFIILSKKQ